LDISLPHVKLLPLHLLDKNYPWRFLSEQNSFPATVLLRNIGIAPALDVARNAASFTAAGFARYVR